MEERKDPIVPSQSSYQPVDKNLDSAYGGSQGVMQPSNDNKEKTEYEKMLEAQLRMYPGGLLDDS